MREIYADMRFATVSLVAIWVKIFWQLTGTTLKIFRALNSIIGRFEWIPFKLFSGQVGRPSRFGLRLAVVSQLFPRTLDLASNNAFYSHVIFRILLVPDLPVGYQYFFSSATLRNSSLFTGQETSNNPSKLLQWQPFASPASEMINKLTG